jgi:hypothetical protein
MKPTHKITIGNEVFMAVKEIDGWAINRVWFDIKELTALNAKIEEIKPFTFEADVEWEVKEDKTVYPQAQGWSSGCTRPWSELIGKRGRLIFQEEV